MEKVIFLMLSLLITGCWKYSIGNIDQPPPYMYQTWKKAGKTELDVKKDMLECGYISVDYDNNYMYEKIGIYSRDERMNYYFMVSLCMEKLGYTRVRTFKETIAESCSQTKNYPERKNYLACQPGVKVPEPTEERRIKGPYCLMEKKEYNRCKIDTQDWSCGSNTFPLACYSNAEYEQYLKTNVSPYPANESNPPVYGTGATPESIRMRNQKLELESLQNQTRQQTNRDMSNMLKQSFPK